jgi:hypothetical protein
MMVEAFRQMFKRHRKQAADKQACPDGSKHHQSATKPLIARPRSLRSGLVAPN